ncbi:Auxin-responsive protein IAA27 [Zea mays]|nr:Auxin-responsive protein IAA27 [Zea mays]ONM19432.1 IAA27-auxin-responsive Aux/IAA family member [Zea mays]
MLNLAPFETPPLGRQETSANNPTVAAVRGNEESSSNTCLHGHLDLSLGISLSHGGCACACDASSCGGNKQESYGGREGSSRDDKAAVGRCMTSGTTTTASVGHDAHAGDLTAGGGGWTAPFVLSPTAAFFMHPWSLAARQQKAAAEQDRTPPPPTTYMSSDGDRAVTSPSAVGWPPVHTSRRNIIVTAMHVSRTAAGATAVAAHDGPDDSTTTTTHAGREKDAVAPPPPTGSSVVIAARRPPPANMFAKVHMDGYAIGRKINLRAQGGYASLSRVLTNMTTNFYSPADCSTGATGTGEKDLPTNNDKFIFLYEDFEGDRMLVGDVPWELFLASAKRLYIVRNPTSSDKG